MLGGGDQAAGDLAGLRAGERERRREVRMNCLPDAKAPVNDRTAPVSAFTRLLGLRAREREVRGEQHPAERRGSL